jgi:hypothetical protein
MTDIQPIAGKTASFDVYRYQLLVDKAVQLKIDSPYHSLEEVRAAKNDIFQNLITNKNFYFKSGKSEITSKLMHSEGTMSYFKIAVKRERRISKKDFTEALVEDYPNILIAFNNAPDVQKIAIQTNAYAFKETDIVSHILQDTLDKELKKESLSFYVEPIFDKKEFWNLVSRYQKQITQLSFDMVSPNMANISRNLQVNLKQLYEDTNSHKTTIELNSDKDSHLEINQQSPLINSLVDYTSEGGGNIALRVNGIRKKLHTAQSKTEFSVDEQLLKSNNWDALNEAFKDILI